MKRLVTTLAAIALAAPSIASAQPAAKALSLSNAAVQPVRASVAMPKKLKAMDDTLMAVGGVIVVGGILCIILCGGSDSD